jgi:nucleoside phosphorylase
VLRHGSEQTTGIFKGETRISLLQLLELRARDSRDSSIAPLLSKKKKKVIAAILAVVLMRALGSQWLQSVWNADNIFFLPSGKATPAPELEMPYFLSCVASDFIRERELEGNAAYDSYIYAFAVLLLELELDQNILVTPEDEEEADEECPPIYMTLLRVFDLRREDLDDPYLLQIIDSCLEFKDRVESIKHESLDEDLKFRAAILRYIVKPLLERIESAHTDIPQELFTFLRQKEATKDLSISQKGSQAHFAKFSSPTTRDPVSSPYFQEVQPQIPSRTNSQNTVSPAPELRPNISPPLSRLDFKIAIICALPLEADAVKAVFDKRWDEMEDVYEKAPRDPNAYATVTIGRHNVVLAHMPGRGQESAAIVAANCQSSFEGIQLALVVGICGGVPRTPLGEEILLGDVVISEGIIPYTFGRQYPGQFVRKDTPLDNFGRPNTEIRMLLAKLKGRGDRRKLESRISDFLGVWDAEIGGTAIYPGVNEDRLFEAGYRHKHHISPSCTICASHVKNTDPTCDQSSELSCEQLKCDTNHLVSRERLAECNANDKQPRPRVHFGLVASGSSVMKSGMDRDSIAKNEDVLAFEMEGAGVWDTFPCLIIKGVCDYADSHKNRRWQIYAAATAATCMKAFLENWAYSKAS